jgi:glycosyltransferase involved in cell wall biosynthesis
VGPGRPKVSVIVPVFDSERYLREALFSVVTQTFTDHETVVIDDGSASDACERIVAAVREETDHRLRYLRQDNRGPAAARNRGLAEGRGELVAFLDSDDVFLAQKLERQVAILDGLPREYTFVTGGYEPFADDTPVEEVRVLPPPLDGDIYPALLHPARAIPWTPAAHLFRRTALIAAGGYDSALRYGEDKELLIRLARTSKARTHRDVVFRKRFHAGSLSVRIEERRLLADVDSLVRRLRAADRKLPAGLLRRMQRETLLSAAGLALRHPGNHARFTRLVRGAMRHGALGASWPTWWAVGVGYATMAMQRLRRSGASLR